LFFILFLIVYSSEAALGSCLKYFFTLSTEGQVFSLHFKKQTKDPRPTVAQVCRAHSLVPSFNPQIRITDVLY